MEASGTSGMKAAANGALNLSVGDGWWLEGYRGDNGWRIGGDRVASDAGVQDEADAASLMHLLEDEVVPLFFRRDAAGLPRDWLARVRRSLATIPAEFDAARMVGEYRDLAYGPLARAFLDLDGDGLAELRETASRRARIARAVAAARVSEFTVTGDATVGRPVDVRADVEIAGVGASDVCVELVVGRRGAAELSGVTVVELAPEASADGALRRFRGAYTPAAPGAFGCFVRVRPRGPVSMGDPAVWA
jgi:starch phosphorylase